MLLILEHSRRLFVTMRVNIHNVHVGLCDKNGKDSYVNNSNNNANLNPKMDNIIIIILILAQFICIAQVYIHFYPPYYFA